MDIFYPISLQDDQIIPKFSKIIITTISYREMIPAPIRLRKTTTYHLYLETQIHTAWTLLINSSEYCSTRFVQNGQLW
jgi:hypothetical protein